MQATTTVTFADWYRQAHPGLVDAVLRAVRQPALAVDAVDEAFARAFARWDRVQAMRSPAGWVYRVAVNEARRQLRRATREDAVLSAAAGRSAGLAPPPGGEAWLLVADLPPRQRAAVVLRHVAGLTESEVGAALGVTRSTVSSSLASAYRSLAAMVAEDDPRSPAPVTDSPTASLVLAVARQCGADGCDLDWLSGGEPVTAAYSDAMRGAVKVRPGDLVAVDPAGPTIVWRWWSGRVESVGDGVVAVSRNVTQSGPDAPRRATMDVELPDDLVGGVEVGETVWFGPGDRDGSSSKVVVAVAGPEASAKVAVQLPAIRRLLG